MSRGQRRTRSTSCLNGHSHVIGTIPRLRSEQLGRIPGRLTGNYGHHQGKRRPWARGGHKVETTRLEDQHDGLRNCWVIPSYEIALYFARKAERGKEEADEDVA